MGIIRLQTVGTGIIYRTQCTPVEYGCRENDCRLKAVLPGETRREKYCPDCQFEYKREGCLFVGPPVKKTEERWFEKRRAAAGRRKGISKRARGLSSNGEPLTESCWNCEAVRICEDGRRYVCGYKPYDKPVSRWTMSHSRTVEATGCLRFKLRLFWDIPLLTEAEREKAAAMML